MTTYSHTRVLIGQVRGAGGLRVGQPSRLVASRSSVSTATSRHEMGLVARMPFLVCRWLLRQRPRDTRLVQTRQEAGELLLGAVSMSTMTEAPLEMW